MRSRLLLTVAALAVTALSAPAHAAQETPQPAVGVILAVKSGDKPPTLFIPNGWNCAVKTYSATFTDLTCDPDVSVVHSPCPLVSASAHATAAPGATASATSTCTGGSASATATAIGDDADTSPALTLPWHCSFAFSPNLSNGWASCGATHL